MAKRNRLTNNSDETEIASLMSGDTIFSIPFFQRAYKWKVDRLAQLNADVLNIVDGSSDFHFLGAIIVHGRRANPSDPNVYEVIDGQQRLTTLYIYLAATVRTLCRLEEFGEAAGLFLKYLVIGREINQITNFKLIPCKEDRSQLNRVLEDILRSKPLKEKLGSFKPKYLPPSGKDSGTLLKNYRATIKFLDSQVEQGGLERIRAASRSLLESMSVVQIDVWDPTNGPKIFDSLNSRQEPMTVGDLVRNEIFSRVADHDQADIENLDQVYWQPFYQKFQQDRRNLFDGYFFPFGLIKDSNLQKSEVYDKLRESWKGNSDPQAIIEDLSKYQDAFIDLCCGTNLQKLSPEIAKGLKDLFRLGAPSTTYPFLMRLSYAVSNSELDEHESLRVLETIESFLVRRATCGMEPTGLHAVFKKLWTDCKGIITVKNVTAEISKHKTVAWPDDGEFKENIVNRGLYSSGILSYLLIEYDRSLGGDQPNNIGWIEHILPENPSKDWDGIFSKQEHQSKKDTIANLLPLSQEMNQSIANKGFALKKERYLSDSMFKSAREVARSYSEWNLQALEKRATEISAWALGRWPHQPSR